MTEPSKYHSFIRPVKFWQKKDADKENSEDGKSHSILSFNFHRNSSDGNTSPEKPVALEENGLTEVYKLSTIDNNGLYNVPSPTLHGKKDHWVESTDELTDFKLPDATCLTSNNKEHEFFTPSNLLQYKSYLLPMVSTSESSLSTTPSMMEDNCSDWTGSSP
ncbi:hypothetical protein BDB01DRAFT_776993 [Pilobolus umbonatus]|nr:hypothetical protein BDB01DRAFT_776993 [Pilobolus umbonatus]